VPPAAAPPTGPAPGGPAEGPRIPRPALGPTGWLDVQIVLLAVAALLLLFLVWRRLGRRSARPVHEPILPPRFTEVPEEEPVEETFAEAETPVPPLPLFEAAAPAEPAPTPEPEAEAVAAAAESDLPAPLGEREAAPLLSGDLDAVVLEERPPAAWAEAPGRLAPPRGGEAEGELSRLVRELERRIAHLETRLEEAADARERLERHMAAQTEELRVQRAAIARTQRVLRSLARPEDLATEPTPRDPGRSGSS
jgi:hypothetical protein